MAWQLLITLIGRSGTVSGWGSDVTEILRAPMNAVTMVSLIEEMVDLKVQRLAESQMKPNPEVARILAEKRVTDQRRLEHIRAELTRLLPG
jgi:hypothetical protein